MGGSLGQIEAANPRLPGGSIGYRQVVGTYVKSPLYGALMWFRGTPWLHRLKSLKTHLITYEG